MNTTFIIVAVILAITIFLSVAVVCGSKISIEKEHTKQRSLSTFSDMIDEKQREELKQIFTASITGSKLR